MQIDIFLKSLRINVCILWGRFVHNPSQWPKPSRFPLSSIVFLFLNAAAAYSLYSLHFNLFWLAPSLLLNIFFFWAERDIYKREKRNYDSWNKEMGYLMGVTDRQGIPLSKSVGSKTKRHKKKRVDNGILSGPQTV